MNPKNALLIALALNGWTDFGSDPFTCFIEGDPPEPGKGKDKTFTQAELDQVVEQRIARERKAFEAKLADATKTEADKAAGLQKQLDEITARLEDAGKSGSDKELAQMKRELQSLNQKLADSAKSIETLTKERDTASARHRDEVVGNRFQAALSSAKALPGALAKAAMLLRQESQVELGEDGKLQVTWNGRVYDETKLAQLGKDFIADNGFLAAHPGGGTGTQHGSGRAPGAAAGEFNEANFGQGLEAYGRRVAQQLGAAGAHDDI